MINLSRVQRILSDAQPVIDRLGDSAVRRTIADAKRLINMLNGKELDETDALTEQTKGSARQARAKRSTDLSLLADRLDLAAALARDSESALANQLALAGQYVRVEYWAARGHKDPTRT